MAPDIHEVPRERGRARRRRYDKAFKRALVEQALAPGASVARIAREFVGWAKHSVPIFAGRRRNIEYSDNPVKRGNVERPGDRFRRGLMGTLRFAHPTLYSRLKRPAR